MPVTPHPDCPAVVHGPAPYGRCICATRPAPTARGADRRTEPRRAEDAALHYSRENLVAAALEAAEEIEHRPSLRCDATLRLVEIAAAYRTAETAALDPA